MAHQRTHSALRPWKCDECDYAAKTETALKMHKISHSDEKPFKCDLCGHAAKRKRTLNSHIQNMHKKTRNDDQNFYRMFDYGKGVG